LPELFANFVAPYLVYALLHDRFGDVNALIASAGPPLLWSGYELLKTRRLDAISVTVVVAIFLTVGATAMGGSAKLIQIRDALVTGAIGVMFLGSFAMEKPMLFYLARATMARNTTAGAATFEALWCTPQVPKLFKSLTLIWGFGLVGQTGLMCYLAWTWPIARYLLLSSPISYTIFALLMLWSFMIMPRDLMQGFTASK
jgi:intracellular septation protein A